MAVFLAAQMQEEYCTPFHTPLNEAPDAKMWMKEAVNGEFKSYYGLGWRIIDTASDRIVFHGAT